MSKAPLYSNSNPATNSSIDADLVRQITQAVLARIQTQIQASSFSESLNLRNTPAQPASIHAPVGICTAGQTKDQSKSQDLSNHADAQINNELTGDNKAVSACSLKAKESPSPSACSLKAKESPSPSACSLKPKESPSPSACSLKPKESPSPSACSLKAKESPSPSACSLKAKENAAFSALAVLQGWVSESRIKKLPVGSTVLLKSCVKFTPLAKDVAKERKLVLQNWTAEHQKQSENQVQNSTSVLLSSALPSTKAPWGWWTEGACPAVTKVIKKYDSELIKIQDSNHPSNLPKVIRQIAEKIRKGEISGALLFVPSMARAICYANRCPSLRAIVGTFRRTVEEGVNELAANVLIIEYPYLGFNGMEPMIDFFMHHSRPHLPEIEQDLNEMSTCG